MNDIHKLVKMVTMEKVSKTELDKLYNTALAYHIGKGGIETSIMMAIECYEEFLEKATIKHSKFLNAHHGLASLYTKMGDMSKESGMKEEATDFYNYAVEHYEVVLVEHKDVAFNDRLLAEMNYEKLRKKMSSGGGIGSFFKKIFG
jgi:hypothetical protein